MKQEYEYIIIGSGVAGSTVARRLLERNRDTSILMLEAGPEVEARNRRSWWDYVVRANGKETKPYDFTYDQPGEGETIGKTPFLIEGSRMMAYGGSTVHWGGWSLRFKPEDFKLFSNTGGGGDFPFSYEDLDPYYYQAEEYLSVCGDYMESWNKDMGFKKKYPRPPFYWTAADGEMIQAFEKHGIEPGKMPVARYRRCMTTGTCKYCPVSGRFSSQDALDQIRADRRNSNFEVRCNSPVIRILTGRKKSKINGVEYLDALTGELKKVLAKKVIICSGTYEAPKLLMLSKSKHWENGIGNDYDLLGRYLVTHSILFVRGELNHNKEKWFQEYDFPTLMSRTYDTEEVQKKTNKIFLFKNRKYPNIDFAQLMIDGKTRDEIDAILLGSRVQELQAFMEEKGRYENRVTLSPGTNRFGLPKMKVDFNRPGSTTDAGNKWLEKMADVIKTMGYREINREIRDPGGHHATGTCRMAERPNGKNGGVTDSDLRVFGTDNLYVCSNAVMPAGAAVNPTLTLTAMAFRLGDHLSGSVDAADKTYQEIYYD